MTSYIAILQNQLVTQIKTNKQTKKRSPLRTHFMSWPVMLTEEITPLCNCENKELCNTSLHPWVPTSLGFFEVTWFYYLRARCPQKKVLWPYEFIWDVCTSYLKLFEAWQFQNNLADNLCMEQSIQELNIASLPPYTYFHSFSSAGRWAGMAFAVWVPMLALRRNSRLEFHLKCLGLSLKCVWRILKY